MTKVLAILGRQPALGLAELESLFGSDAVQPVGDAVLVDVTPDEFPMSRLGGTVKAAKLLTTLPFTDWGKLTDYLIENVPKHSVTRGPGKLIFGLSVYGLKVSQQSIERTALGVKKAVRTVDGRGVRVVPTKGTELNSAQLLHNRLTDTLGMELLLVRDGTQTHLAQTFAFQDIEAYAARDQVRPKRDARVGMLPPKLAQIIVNLAIDKNRDKELRVLDPFCGTGVVLQESLLMGYSAYGSDLEPRMVEYSLANLTWLDARHHLPAHAYRTEQGDATDHQWQKPFDTVAGETYLGRPFSAPPAADVLREVMRDVDTIHRKFLRNVARQTQPGFRLCIAVPAWKLAGSAAHLNVLDSLEELGYNRVRFVHVRDTDLLYYRPGQIVARELVVLTRR